MMTLLNWARKVYITNDKRSYIKKPDQYHFKINVVEVKSYQNY